ncbi:hypothetical protein BH23CHL5_BH23CHL5_07000 [soil metagenome]
MVGGEVRKEVYNNDIGKNINCLADESLLSRRECPQGYAMVGVNHTTQRAFGRLLVHW